MISLPWCAKHAGRRACSFLYSLLVYLGLHNNFFKSDLCFTQDFIFGGLCSDTVEMCVSLHSDTSNKIQQLDTFLVVVTTCYSSSGILGKAHFLCQYTLTTSAILSWYSEGHFECLSFSCSFILLLSLFHFSSVSASETISAATQSSSLVIPSSCCGCCYRCIPTHKAFCFKVLGYLCPLMTPGQVLCMGFILPFRSFKQLPLCCV